MSIGSALAIYFIIWWMTLFAVLPWGVRTQEEDGEVTSGTVPSAPSRPLIIRKLIITTVVAGIVYGILAALWAAGYRIEDIPVPGPD